MKSKILAPNMEEYNDNNSFFFVDPTPVSASVFIRSNEFRRIGYVCFQIEIQPR